MQNLNGRIGNETNATKDLESLDRSAFVDTAHEKLFIARLCEALAKANEGNNTAKFERYSSYLLEYYPQLIPFSGITCLWIYLFQEQMMLLQSKQ